MAGNALTPMLSREEFRQLYLHELGMRAKLDEYNLQANIAWGMTGDTEQEAQLQATLMAMNKTQVDAEAQQYIRALVVPMDFQWVYTRLNLDMKKYVILNYVKLAEVLTKQGQRPAPGAFFLSTLESMFQGFNSNSATSMANTYTGILNATSNTAGEPGSAAQSAQNIQMRSTVATENPADGFGRSASQIPLQNTNREVAQSAKEQTTGIPVEETTTQKPKIISLSSNVKKTQNWRPTLPQGQPTFQAPLPEGKPPAPPAPPAQPPAPPAPATTSMKKENSPADIAFETISNIGANKKMTHSQKNSAFTTAVVGFKQEDINELKQILKNNGMRDNFEIRKKRGGDGYTISGNFALSGKGLPKRKCKSTRKYLSGAGVVTQGPVRADHGWQEFGKYMLARSDLENGGRFHMRYKNGQKIQAIPQRVVGAGVKNVLSKIADNKAPNYDDVSKLSDEEKNYVQTLLAKASLDPSQFTKSTKSESEAAKHRFDVLKGQIVAGNDSPELIKEFKHVVTRMKQTKQLPPNEVNEILMELASLGH